MGAGPLLPCPPSGSTRPPRTYRWWRPRRRSQSCMIMITVRVSMRCIITLQDTDYTNLSSVADPGMFMPDPGSRRRIFPSRIRIKEFTWEKLYEMFVRPGSRMRIFSHPGSRVNKAPDPGSGSATLLNCMLFFLPYVATYRFPSPLLLSA